MFCPKCGSLLKPKVIGNRKSLICSCGYSDKGSSQPHIKEELKAEEKGVEVVEFEDEETLPETKAECPRCGNTKARYWLIQTRAADEAETKFFKCTKCRHTWRDYS